MYKCVVEYYDFDEPPQKQTMTAFFALNEAKFLELQGELGGHVDERVRIIREKKDEAALIDLVKKLMRASYGERSADKQRLDRSDDAWNRFYDSNAYSACLMKILQNDSENAAFLRGILPAEIAKESAGKINDLLAKKSAS